MALIDADTSKLDKDQMVAFLFNLATSGDVNTFRQDFALRANNNSMDENNDPNWIDLSSISAPKEGESEKNKVKGKFVCYCDFHKAWSSRKSYASATFNSKKRLDTAPDGNEVTLQVNLASVAAQQEDQMHSHVNMHTCSHAHIYSNDSLDDEPLTEDLNDEVPEQDIFDFSEEDDVLSNKSTIVTDVISN